MANATAKPPPPNPPRPLRAPAPRLTTTPTLLRSSFRRQPLSPEMAAYFPKCEEKLGFVPNVLKAYAFDMAKLGAFVAMYNDLMLAPSA